MEPLHGSVLGPVNRARTEEAARRARSILIDEQLKALIGRPDRAPVPRSRQIYVNRNLRMSNVSAVGFDMDYTLAIYHLRRIEQLSFDMTVTKLITAFGYPPELDLARAMDARLELVYSVAPIGIRQAKALAFRAGAQ